MEVEDAVTTAAIGGEAQARVAFGAVTGEHPLHTVAKQFRQPEYREEQLSLAASPEQLAAANRPLEGQKRFWSTHSSRTADILSVEPDEVTAPHALARQLGATSAQSGSWLVGLGQRLTQEVAAHRGSNDPQSVMDTMIYEAARFEQASLDPETSAMWSDMKAGRLDAEQLKELESRVVAFATSQSWNPHPELIPLNPAMQVLNSDLSTGETTLSYRLPIAGQDSTAALASYNPRGTQEAYVERLVSAFSTDDTATAPVPPGILGQSVTQAADELGVAPERVAATVVGNSLDMQGMQLTGPERVDDGTDYYSLPAKVKQVSPDDQLTLKVGPNGVLVTNGPEDRDLTRGRWRAGGLLPPVTPAQVSVAQNLTKNSNAVLHRDGGLPTTGTDPGLHFVVAAPSDLNNGYKSKNLHVALAKSLEQRAHLFEMVEQPISHRKGQSLSTARFTFDDPESMHEALLLAQEFEDYQGDHELRAYVDAKLNAPKGFMQVSEIMLQDDQGRGVTQLSAADPGDMPHAVSVWIPRAGSDRVLAKATGTLEERMGGYSISGQVDVMVDPDVTYEDVPNRQGLFSGVNIDGHRPRRAVLYAPKGPLPMIRYGTDDTSEFADERNTYVLQRLNHQEVAITADRKDGNFTAGIRAYEVADLVRRLGDKVRLRST